MKVNVPKIKTLPPDINVEDIVFDSNTLCYLSGHANLLSIFTSKWSYLENSYADILCNLIGNNSNAIIDLYNGNRNFQVKNSLIKSIMQHYADGILFQYCKVICDAAVLLSNARNTFCHDILGHILNRKDFLFSYKSEFFAKKVNRKKNYTHKTKNDYVYIYSISDLNDLITAIDTVEKSLNLIFIWISAKRFSPKSLRNSHILSELGLLLGK
jgi:hypothetical protein